MLTKISNVIQFRNQDRDHRMLSIVVTVDRKKNKVVLCAPVPASNDQSILASTKLATQLGKIGNRPERERWWK